MVPVLGSWAYNDLALAFYQMAALYALLNWFQERAKRPRAWAWLALSAAFSGMAMGLKYTAFVCPLTVVLLIAWHLARARAPWGAWLRVLLLFGGVAVIVAAPWYLRNLLFTGNPVYPFAYRLFGGSGWDDWRADWYARVGSGLGWDLGELFKLPWTLTLGFRDMNFYDGRMGPLFLLALPFAIAWSARLFGRPGPRPRGIACSLTFALVQYAFWTVGVASSRSLFQSRLLLPAFVALCAPLAYLFDELGAVDTRLFSLRRLVGMSVVLVLAANLCYQFLDTLRVNPLPVLVGEEDREGFLARNLGAHYAGMALVNERIPEDWRVLFLWEPRSYYSRRAVQPDAILERWAWLLHQYDGDLAVIAHVLRDEGYTHLLLHRSGLELVRQARLDPLIDPDFAAWDTFAAGHLHKQAEVGTSYELYRLLDWSDQE